MAEANIEMNMETEPMTIAGWNTDEYWKTRLSLRDHCPSIGPVNAVRAVERLPR